MTNYTTTTKPPSINSTVRGGPWNSWYEVTAQTVAVNLAQLADFSNEIAPPQVAVERAIDTWESEDVIRDGSIRGFWAWVWSGLDLGTQRDISHLAEDLLRRHQAAPFGSKDDLHEMFDGQR